MCRQSATVCLIKSPSPRQRELPDVAERLATLLDPRNRQGRRHSLVSVLLTAACAVLAGARSYLAIGQWARNAPQDCLARLGIPPRGPLGIRRAPATSTIRRVLILVCPGGLADLLGSAPGDAGQVVVDGKTARGSRTDTDDAVHLLLALTGSGRVVSQLPVPDKTTEVTALPALLAPFDLTDCTVTADTLHTTREQARYLVEEKKAHFVFVVKRNQPRLYAALRALPWKECTAVRYDREQGHGRRETRSVRALTVTGLGLDFPHLAQAVKIHRYRTDVKSGKTTRQTIYAITDMTSRQSSPQRLGQLARAQWSIESVHHVRDTTFAEDASKVRTGHGPANMATLRNLALNTLRDAGHHSIAAGLRQVSYTPFTHPLDLLRLT